VTQRGVDESADDPSAQLAGFVEFCRRILRFWRVPAVVLVVGAVAGAVCLLIRKPVYRSETVILYSEGVRQPDDEDRPENARSVAVRFREILMSRASLDAVVREFNLYPDIRKTRGPVDAVEELRKHVEYRSPGGDTFSIAFIGASPIEAQRVTARLGELVVDRDSEVRRKRVLITRDFLEKEEHATEEDLRAKEQALAAFMGAHPRFAFDATPQLTGAAFRASLGVTPPARHPSGGPPRARELGPAIAVPGGPPPMIAANPASGDEARAAAGVAAARTNLAELLTRFTAAHPDVRAASAEVERAESRLAAARVAAHAPRPVTSEPPKQVEEPAPAKSPPPGSATPRAMPRVVAVTPPAPSASSAKEPETVALETEWAKLTRAVTEARQHQDHIEAALFKANLSASSESGGHGVQVTIIDPAFLPEKPMPPGRVVIAVTFLAVASVLGVACAVLFAVFDDRVHSGREIARLLPVLVEVPRQPAGRAHAAG
jgi:capsular polysaccharide biosynthesis protein